MILTFDITKQKITSTNKEFVAESFYAIATNTTGGFIGACKITTAGVVSITAGSTAAVYMDGVNFYAEL